eukprot:jgi/Mesen1/5031/ME000025S04430
MDAEQMDFNVPDQEDFEKGLGDTDTAAFAPQKEGEEKNITPDGGLKKLLVKAGQGWEKPETGDDVAVHYTGTLLDGTKFDSSLDRNQPFTFKLGQGQVIRGWDKGVATMTKGEKALFTIAAEYAYGEAGSPPTIPPNSTLKFEVELLSWTSVKDICGDGGVVKKVLVEGTKWEMPKDRDQVTVKYEVRLQDGTILAKSPEEGVEFYVQEGHFCPAIAKAVKTMYKGQRALLTAKAQYGFGEAGRPGVEGQPGVPANETLSIDLELVSWKTVEDVTSDGKVLKKTLTPGTGYEKPNDGAVVKVRYTGKLPDGTIFEKQGYEGQEFEFVTDEEQVVEGLEKAVLKMKKGEVASVTVSPQYGFGDKEEKKDLAVVPPGSTLEYEVELVDFVKDKESWDMSDQEKVDAAAKRKEEGNALFKAGKYVRAVNKYSKGLKLIEYDSQFDPEPRKQARALQMSYYLNEAACRLKLKEYNQAITSLCKVLERETQNVKALFRRAQAYIGTQDYDLAEWDLKKALEVDPNNREVKAEYRVLKQKIAEQNKKEAKLFGNMFARLNKLEEKESKKVENGSTTEPTPVSGVSGIEESTGPMVVEED